MGGRGGRGGGGDKEKKAIRIKKGMLGNPSCKLHFIPV